MDPIRVEPANPLPLNALSNDTGDAAADGYSVLSRANRYTDQRPRIGGTPTYWGPRSGESL
jgi:hypothetical protein